ncbi:hypothetical protein BYT27DRAFT_7260384 [Phlegmacium glaucopus]|nr:hypothetical protein BYT27DRAFT_7260384 [Phlegmacium glaucopus]
MPMAISANLEKLVHGTFESNHPFWDSWEKHEGEELLDFSWSIHLPKHPIKLRDQPLTVQKSMVYEGKTLDDREWESQFAASL